MRWSSQTNRDWIKPIICGYHIPAFVWPYQSINQSTGFKFLHHIGMVYTAPWKTKVTNTKNKNKKNHLLKYERKNQNPWNWAYGAEVWAYESCYKKLKLREIELWNSSSSNSRETHELLPAKIKRNTSRYETHKQKLEPEIKSPKISCSILPDILWEKEFESWQFLEVKNPWVKKSIEISTGWICHWRPLTQTIL